MKKADAYKLKDSNELLLTSDTVVKVDDQVLGKAKRPSECLSMLKLLSGRAHEVITGVCLKSNLKKISFDETTIVHFKELSEKEMSYYIEEYNPLDKAGAYGIQEWIGMVGIERIEGDYYNVMGCLCISSIKPCKKISVNKGAQLDRFLVRLYFTKNTRFEIYRSR